MVQFPGPDLPVPQCGCTHLLFVRIDRFGVVTDAAREGTAAQRKLSMRFVVLLMHITLLAAKFAICESASPVTDAVFVSRSPMQDELFQRRFYSRNAVLCEKGRCHATEDRTLDSPMDHSLS